VLSLLQRFNRREARSSSEAVPPLGQDLFQLFDVKGASDEMFFPCCLAVLGYLNPPSSPAALGGSAAAGNGAGMAQVIKKQITYADWRGQAKNPIRYTTFPTALVQKITAVGVPGVATTATSAGSKRRLHHSSGSGGGIADDNGEAPEVDSTQQSAVFLRKVQFPAAPAAGASACTEAQRLFLQDWLRCLLAQGLDYPAGVGAFSAVGPTETAAVTAAGVDGEGRTADAIAGGIDASAAGARDATAAPSAVQQPEEEGRWMERALQLCEEAQRYRR
jgi:hypothetical protein